MEVYGKMQQSFTQISVVVVSVSVVCDVHSKSLAVSNCLIFWFYRATEQQQQQQQQHTTATQYVFIYNTIIVTGHHLVFHSIWMAVKNIVTLVINNEIKFPSCSIVFYFSWRNE